MHAPNRGSLALKVGICGLLFVASPLRAAERAFFNVKDFGATGHMADNARPAIQKAIDTCAAAGGGTVYVPPGEYTSGTIHLRSRVRLYIEAGATIYASKNSGEFDKLTLIYGEDLENITLEGRGTLDGQSEYEWREDELDDAYFRDSRVLMIALGKSLLRSFPKGFPKETVYPKMVLLLRCKDVRIAGLSFVRSRSWTIHPYACERLVIDGVYIYSSLKEAVWADGIDPDSCKDVRISNCTIETGDDAIVLYSANIYGPALPCENITVTNCRLTSASSALKFCDGNLNAIRNVTIDNCVITGSNRGIAFMVYDGGYVNDVVLSNLTVETVRHDWFWWGEGDPIHFNIKRRSEVDSIAREKEPPAGAIRNVLIRNVIARGQGTSGINGHPDSWLDGVSLENVKLFLSTNPESPFDKAVHAMKIRWAKNLKMKDVEVTWDKPESAKWESAISVEDVKDLELEGITARQAKLDKDMPAVVLNQVEGAMIRNSKAQPGTGLFLSVQGDKSREIYLSGNDLRQAKVAYRVGPEVKRSEVESSGNLLPRKRSAARSAGQ